MLKCAGGLGFRDLELFNQALLAKQAWRLLHEPNCLFSRFFKSRYYKKTCFLQGKLGSRPSYGWRSIFFGRNLLLKGLKRVIGNGKDMVSDLIHLHSSLWNIWLLGELLHPDDVSRILSTKPLLARQDSYCWAGNRNGVYSVKSGYELIYHLENKEKFVAPSLSPSLFPISVDCWKLKTSPKIQVFLWKSIKGAIIVSERLQTRGIHNYDGCLLCGAVEETVNHILFLCPYARQVWALSNILVPPEGFGCIDLENFKYVFSMRHNENISNETRAIFPWIVWFLWKNRNKLLFNGSLYPPDCFVCIAYEDSIAWLSAQVPNHNVSLSTSYHTFHWSPPLWAEVKCNIGFSWSKNLALSSASWVVRDPMENVLLHSRRSYSQVASVFKAKIKSREWALESM
ncbi:putative reverse transcriptase zinc-binding domain-containing protein [Arabidopsis thaliana]